MANQINKSIKFDWTINIPTLITLIVLTLGIYRQASRVYATFQVIVQQHQLMWKDYLSKHPEFKYLGNM